MGVATQWKHKQLLLTECSTRQQDFKKLLNFKSLCCLTGLRDSECICRILELDLELLMQWKSFALRRALELNGLLILKKKKKRLIRIKDVVNKWLQTQKPSRIALFRYLCPLSYSQANSLLCPSVTHSCFSNTPQSQEYVWHIKLHKMANSCYIWLLCGLNDRTKLAVSSLHFMLS